MAEQLELKKIHRDAIPAALDKAIQYRLLNEPRAAESICLDVLAVDPDNRGAVVLLLLSLTDQFGAGGFAELERRARELLPKLGGEYDRLYYTGLIFERRGKAQLDMGVPGQVAYAALREAMNFYEQAEQARPEGGSDDPILRWNTCARILNSDPGLGPEDTNPGSPYHD